MTYARILTNTPQSEPIPGKNMVKNSAGGYAFAVDKWARLKRFLVLGSDGGTYYIDAKKLTLQNAQVVMDCLAEDGLKTVDTIVSISESGRAPRNSPALFALALAMTPAYANEQTRQRAGALLPLVARTSTHLFEFLNEVTELRGWGRALRQSVADWYTGKTDHQLAYQVVKYKSRAGWTHRDVLRQAHPQARDERQARIYDYIAHGTVVDGLPDIVIGATKIFEPGLKKAEVIKLIYDYKLTHEMVPNEWKAQPEVWEALLENMPLTAMIRNLGVMSSCDLIVSLSDASQKVIGRLQDRDLINKARVHPVTILNALLTYKSGHGVKGSKSWRPDYNVCDALDDAFHLAFETIKPSGKRFMLGLDVSGSMGTEAIKGMALTARHGAAAMAMATARVEPKYVAYAFSTRFIEFPIRRYENLDHVMMRMSAMPFGGTDCSLPIEAARQYKLLVDTFIIYTDKETWAGRIHPIQALARYRDESGLPAKLIVVGMTSNGFSIADPSDSGMLDVVGFDTATPRLISDFAADGF